MPSATAFPPSQARTSGHPILTILVAFPIAFFTGALATDIAYAATADFLWADFSAWLLAAAMAGAVLAALAGLVTLVANRHHTRRTVWPFVVGAVLVLAIGLLDNLVHSRDGWTAIVPMGLALSWLVVGVVLATAWLGAAANARPAIDPRTSEVRP